MVSVDSNLVVPDELTVFRARVLDLDERVRVEHAFSLADGVSLPASFGVGPVDEDPAAQIIVEVDAIGPTVSGVGTLFTRRAVTGFVTGQALLLPFFLARDCVLMDCGDGLTCTENGCESDRVPPSGLRPIAPGDELRPPADAGGPADGGATDASAGDASTGDASTGDASTGDAATGDASVADAGPAQLMLTVVNAGAGAGSVVSNLPGIDCGEDCEQSFVLGTRVVLDQIALAGSAFAGWSGACSGLGTCTATVTETTSVTATFDTVYLEIPPGTFTMGTGRTDLFFMENEDPPHTVEITRPFFLKQTKVTQGEWLKLMGGNPSFFKGCGLDCPVNAISWSDAILYVNALSRNEGRSECYSMVGVEYVFAGIDCPGYRLPTEAEWEYAARAGTTGPLPNGAPTVTDCDQLDPALGAIAWYCANADVDYHDCVDRTMYGFSDCVGMHPVARKLPNPWGLYGMIGNAYEPVNDWYVEDYYASSGSQDPLGPPTGTERGLRGCAWHNQPVWCRTAVRRRREAGVAAGDNGLRPARTKLP